MKRTLVAGAVLAAALACAVAPELAWAAATTVPAGTSVVVVDPNAIHIGQFTSDFLNLYLPVLATVIGALWGYLKWKLTGKQTEATDRAALETFVTNAAGGFLARFDSIKAKDLHVGNPLIAQLANEAPRRVPDALSRFKLGVDDVKKRIIEKVGILTAVDTTTTSTTLPPPPV